MEVLNPLKWNAEYPNLYKLRLQLTSSAGSEVIEKMIGFRELEVVGNQLFLNGTPIKLHGVNRHEVHPLTGRSLNMELWRKDALLYKEANVNYIRTSHYPPAEEFIDLCDSIGFYVELENPLVWIGHNANLSLQFQGGMGYQASPGTYKNNKGDNYFLQESSWNNNLVAGQ